jgi:hypothetical protein
MRSIVAVSESLSFLGALFRTGLIYRGSRARVPVFRCGPALFSGTRWSKTRVAVVIRSGESDRQGQQLPVP